MSADAQQILADGSRFAGFTVIRLLGRGAASEVYLVEDAVAGALRAVKVLDPEAVRLEPDFLSRFAREARAQSALRHPNLVEVLDAGRDEETGLCHLTMEYMPRGSLREALEAAKEPFDLTTVAKTAADIAAALAAIEARGLVHRDVKPANILLAADGTAKLADLGVLRPARGGAAEAAVDANVTQAGEVVGTPAYMAPEQMLDSRAVDVRADLYALGVVMFEMLAGRRPNEGENAMTTLARALDGREPPDVRTLRADCPAPLAALVRLLMQPNPEARPVGARAVLAMLADPARIPLPPRADEAAAPWYEDRSVLYALVALVFSLEALAVALVSVFLRRGV